MRRHAYVDDQSESLIHPTAIVSDKSHIAKGVRIGPYSDIGENVSIGKDSEIGSHVVLRGPTSIGENNRIYPGAVLGMDPQITGFNSQTSSLHIGDNNIIREYVTIHRGGRGGSRTTVGNHNYLMANVHIGHDCTVGNHIILTNAVLVGGHVTIEDHAVMGALTGIHQHVRIGSYSMTGGLARATLDVLPYSLCEGHHLRLIGVNQIGMKRAGFSTKQIQDVKKAYRALFFSKKNIFEKAVNDIEETMTGSKEVRHIVEFIRKSKRGITQRG